MRAATVRRFLFVAFAFLVLLFRSKSLFENPQFFLEDGTLFFIDAYNDGGLSLTQSYAGYFVFYQRASAWVCSFFPLVSLPACYLLCGSIVSFVFLWELSAEFFPGKWGMLAVLVFVLSPFDGTDVITLTNSQWVLGAWLMLFVASGKMEQAVKPTQLALFLIAALTGPFILILSPLIFLRFVNSRGRMERSWAILPALLILLQTLAIGELLAPRVLGDFHLRNADWIRASAMLSSYPLDLLLGEAKSLFESGIILFLGVATYAVLFMLSRRVQDSMSQYLLFAALLFSGAALLAYRSDPSYLLFRPRYALLPTLAVGWAFLSLAVRANAPLLTFALLPLALATAFHFFTPALDDFHWKSASNCIGKDESCEIPLNWKGKTISYSPQEASGAAGRKGFLKDIS